MARTRKLLNSVEKLLTELLTEAADNKKDDIGRPLISFGDRLRLAEVATGYEVRRHKIEDTEEPDEMGSIMQEFHGERAATSGRPGRKARKETADGSANGHVAATVPYGEFPGIAAGARSIPSDAAAGADPDDG
jgi:hypothetical protein